MTKQRQQRAAILASSILFLTLFAQPGYAAPLEISGTVAAPNGVKISGVDVSDGFRTSTTNAAGQYSIQELQFGTYTITAARYGLSGGSASVTLSPTSPSAVKNFTLSYMSSLSIATQYLSTAAGSATLTVTLKSYAPLAGSCAKITDTRTGATTAMTHTGTEAGQQVWQYTPTLAAQTPEGTFTLTARVDDCTTGTRIDTGAQQLTYVIDNTSPDLYAYAPQDAGNCLVPCRDYAFVLHDSGGGIQTSTVRFSLSDAGTPIVTEGIPTVSFASGAYVGFSYQGPPLPVDRIYQAAFQVDDRAGNRRAIQFQLLVVSLIIPNPLVQIQATPATLALDGNAVRATFQDVEAEIGSYAVKSSGTLHPGSGAIAQKLDISSATVAYQVADGTWFTAAASSLPRSNPALWDARIAYQHLARPSVGVGSESIGIAAVKVSLGALDVRLPADVTAATLQMPPTPTSTETGRYPGIFSSAAAIPCGVCPDPFPVPNPDPYPIYSARGPAYSLVRRMEAVEQDAAEKLGPHGPYISAPPGYAQYISTCSRSTLDGEPEDCEIVQGSAAAANPDGTCPPKMVCAPPGVTQLAMQPSDFRRCSIDLACSAVESTVRPTGQINDDQRPCRDPDANGRAYCTADHWHSLNSKYMLAPSPRNSDGTRTRSCKGVMANGERMCEWLHEWSSWGDSGRFRFVEDGFQSGVADPRDQTMFPDESAHEAEVDYISRAGCSAEDSSGNAIPITRPYTSQVVTRGSESLALGFKFSTIQGDPSCRYGSVGGTLYFTYWLETPVYVNDPNGFDTEPFQSEYERIDWDCAWDWGPLENVSVGVPLGISVGLPNTRCEERSTFYKWIWHYLR